MFESSYQVIENIHQAVLDQNFHAKVQDNDASLSSQESSDLIANYWKYKQTRRAKIRNHNVQKFMDRYAMKLVPADNIKGLEKIADLHSGAIVTSNHFSPLENLAVRSAVRHAGYQNLSIVSQETNLMAAYPLHFIFWNYDLIPIASQGGGMEYMGREFPHRLETTLSQGNPILIYPEQEMWYNYRKPRPLQRGAYYYAARFNVPIISLFVEIIQDDELSNDDFYKTHYRVHVLEPIFPDPDQSIKANSIRMQELDYQQKCQAYEKTYHRPLSYRWEDTDIAGLRPRHQSEISTPVPDPDRSLS